LRNLHYRSERHPAEMIAEDASGNPRTASPNFDKGDIEVMGRHLAVADVRRPFHARWSGYLACLAWLLIHWLLLGVLLTYVS
jgi:NADH dehydrogenase FAD-containing subunit